MNATSAPPPGPQSVLQGSPEGGALRNSGPGHVGAQGGRFANRPYGREGFPLSREQRDDAPTASPNLS